jgi:hypothetical protein
MEVGADRFKIQGTVMASGNAVERRFRLDCYICSALQFRRYGVQSGIFARPQLCSCSIGTFPEDFFHRVRNAVQVALEVVPDQLAAGAPN